MPTFTATGCRQLRGETHHAVGFCSALKWNKVPIQVKIWTDTEDIVPSERNKAQKDRF